MKIYSTLILAAWLLTVVGVVAPPSVDAACVWVNGVPLSYQEIRQAEQLIGMEIVCGVYAFNHYTGAWWDFTRGLGGNIHDRSSQSSPGSFPSQGEEQDCSSIAYFGPYSDYTYIGDGC